MPQNIQLASEQYDRYAFCRDSGHAAYVQKAVTCEDFFAGFQWSAEDKAALKAARRPALTINKILITLMSIFGEQIQSRADISFQARTNANPDTALALALLWKQVSDANQFNWTRDDVFADASITSRGFYDMRLDFKKNMSGDIVISRLLGKNVVLDPDATDYDPDNWNDVFVSKWYTADEIAIDFNEDDAKALATKTESTFQYGFDSIDYARDRFGGPMSHGAYSIASAKSVLRNIRVLERQYRERKRVKFFVDPRTGDRREVPLDWDRNAIAEMASRSGLLVIDDWAKKIRWRVTADDYVLHDDWSPYEHFTVIPYFPVFRAGRTIGLVENLIDPQELLNKSSSQELHIVNTTSNSGWKLKRGSLQNMTIDELEEFGAKTGLVMELDDVADAEKITPNPVPTGLDRVSYKAEEHIKNVSGRGDSQLGLDRADVAARATEAKQRVSAENLLPALTNLERSDFFIARQFLSLVRNHYTDPRVYTITKNDITQEQETFYLNWPNPESGELINDVTRGEYDFTVVSTPLRRTLEESQFQQAVGMREMGVKIPDEFLIKNSNLQHKAALLREMAAASQSEQAQFEAKVATLGQQLQLAELKANTSKSEADAALKQAKAEKELANTMALVKESSGEDPELIKAEQMMQLEREKHQMNMQMEREKHEQKLQLEREKHAADLEAKRMLAAEQARMQRAQAILTARQTPKPSPQPQAQGA